MKIHYPLGSDFVLDHSNGKLLEKIKEAGIDQVWLHGYFYGHMVSSVTNMRKAKAVLQEKGFEVGAFNVPLGHPGNALNPDDPSFELTIPSSWRYRKDRQGNPIYFCADIEENMIRDRVVTLEPLEFKFVRLQ